LTGVSGVGSVGSLLAEDLDRIVERAKQHWTFAMGKDQRSAHRR
jgi:hypothetical protein